MNEEKPTCTVYSDGVKYWKLNGQLHRLDGPAIEWSGGGKQWYVNGEFIYAARLQLSVGQLVPGMKNGGRQMKQ